MKWLKNIFKDLLQRILHLNFISERQIGHLQTTQKLLSFYYRDKSQRGEQLPTIEEVEYKVYSQQDTDGIIVFLLSLVEINHRRFLEIGIGDGTECFSANLAKCMGWSGWMIEGDASLARSARNHYLNNKHTLHRDIHVIEAVVTKENIETLIEKNGMTNRVDFLSIDIDGMDWWIWDAIHNISPALVTIEYNASLGSEKSITVPYHASFRRHEHHSSGFYHGASIRALVKLGEKKGYQFVGCDSCGINAFFMRKDLAPTALSKPSVEKGFRPHLNRNRRMPFEKQFELVRDLPWTEIP